MLNARLKIQLAKLPDSPGVYQFFNKEKKLLYVGKSVSIKKRVSSYFTNKNLGLKTNQMVKEISNINFIKVFSEFEALLLEAELIKKNQPFYNSVTKDNKSPLYIKITSGQIPLVTTIRAKAAQKDVFLKGPFPSARTTRDVLKIVRKIFPYCHHPNPKKPCLYVHLGLCPYPYQSPQVAKTYQVNIKKIKKILSGKSQNLIRQLIIEMRKLAQNEKYEQAQIVKEQIAKLQYIISTYHGPDEFLSKPSLVDDLAASRLKDLEKKLNLPKIPKRIECYDISDISGKAATGSMVVFENGQKASHQYRRFRIKFTRKIDDYLMLEEILTRRFKNNWPKPDLIIIDGGRGHLNRALAVLRKFSLKIPVIALAKRLESLYSPNKILPIALQKDNPTQLLVQAIRDEAHRFALAYHRKLRSKIYFPKSTPY